mmetsp:Transcript_13226/g.35575  ORF Transcript_13226/g.35575 Transcript_13226/m.35575 type:complete len:344 (+) Transcript_13226:1288-2319(+)
MYNGIGLPTPRGTGTSGHVVRHAAHDPRKQAQRVGGKNARPTPPRAAERKPKSAQLAEHEKLRSVEVAVAEFEEGIRAAGETDELVILESCNAKRTELMMSTTGVMRSNASSYDKKRHEHPFLNEIREDLREHEARARRMNAGADGSAAADRERVVTSHKGRESGLKQYQDVDCVRDKKLRSALGISDGYDSSQAFVPKRDRARQISAPKLPSSDGPDADIDQAEGRVACRSQPERTAVFDSKERSSLDADQIQRRTGEQGKARDEARQTGARDSSGGNRKHHLRSEAFRLSRTGHSDSSSSWDSSSTGTSSRSPMSGSPDQDSAAERRRRHRRRRRRRAEYK